jgi:hypothetical protein
MGQSRATIREWQLVRLSTGGQQSAQLGFKACRNSCATCYSWMVTTCSSLMPWKGWLRTWIRTHRSQRYSVPILIDEAGTYRHRRGSGSGHPHLGARMPDTVDTPIEVICRARAMPRRPGPLSYAKTNGWDESLADPHDRSVRYGHSVVLTGRIHRLETPTVASCCRPPIAALYEGLMAVDRKWWNASLSTEARRRIWRVIDLLRRC